jgi:uncharacterized membrane protein
MKTDRTEEAPSFGDSLLRLAGTAIVVMLALWLALRVVAGVLSFIVWLVSTALLVLVVLAVLSFAFGRRHR